MSVHRNTIRAALCIACWGACAFAATHAWSMGTPPFDTVLRSSFSQETATAIEYADCLEPTETVSVSSIYRRNRSRKPIEGISITTSFSMPVRTRGGEKTIVTSTVTGATDATGTVSFSSTVSAVVQDLLKSLEQDQALRGARREKGPIEISFTTADTLKRSVRYSPPNGLRFTLCRDEGKSRKYDTAADSLTASF